MILYKLQQRKLTNSYMTKFMLEIPHNICVYTFLNHKSYMPYPTEIVPMVERVCKANNYILKSPEAVKIIEPIENINIVPVLDRKMFDLITEEKKL